MFSNFSCFIHSLEDILDSSDDSSENSSSSDDSEESSSDESVKRKRSVLLVVLVLLFVDYSIVSEYICRAAKNKAKKKELVAKEHRDRHDKKSRKHEDASSIKKRCVKFKKSGNIFCICFQLFPPNFLC